MQEEHVLNVCRVGTHHKNDFNEVMTIVQVSIGNCEIMDEPRWWVWSKYYF
jgi:hypothetical protein